MGGRCWTPLPLTARDRTGALADCRTATRARSCSASVGDDRGADLSRNDAVEKTAAHGRQASRLSWQAGILPAEHSPFGVWRQARTPVGHDRRDACLPCAARFSTASVRLRAAKKFGGASRGAARLLRHALRGRAGGLFRGEDGGDFPDGGLGGKAVPFPCGVLHSVIAFRPTKRKD